MKTIVNILLLKTVSIKGYLMKKGIHPDYGPVVFRDRSANYMFLTKSTAKPSETVEFEGSVYPVLDVDVSSASHPFWTGRSRVLDTEGRVEKFRRRYGASGASAVSADSEAR